MSTPELRLPLTLLVEFGPLDEEQQTLIDRHELRAVGTATTSPSDGVVVDFWVRDGEDLHELYDDIRGWAIGNRLPIRGVVEQ
jgi:hypothetical protein